MNSEEKMPFTQHLEELRKRIIICIAAVRIGFLVSYGFKETIFGWLMRPMIEALPEGASRKLIYTGPVEALLTYLKVSFIGGIGLATPVILYQFWRFVAPGLYAHERKYLYPVLISSTVFFLGGALFGYYVVFPYGFQFFPSFANDPCVCMPLPLMPAMGLAMNVAFRFFCNARVLVANLNVMTLSAVFNASLYLKSISC